jgi:hypothetical protein
MLRLVPVIKLALLLARNKAACATSSGLEIRSTGSIELTRTSGEQSIANDRVRETNAPLLVEYRQK